MIIPNWTTFRHHFAPRAFVGPIPCTFLTTSPPRITRTDAGSFVTDGVQLGHVADIAGTISNNTRVHVDAFESNGSPNDTIVCAAADVLVAEVCATTRIEAFILDGDGVPLWPIELVRKPGSGFGDAGSTLTGIPAWFNAAGGLDITCNAGAADAVAGVDDFDWYLSQRTDEEARQYLEMVNLPEDGGETFSGFVNIRLTALGLTLTPPEMVSVQNMRRFFKYAALYVRRRSDGAIQWLDLYRAMVRQDAVPL